MRGLISPREILNEESWPTKNSNVHPVMTAAGKILVLRLPGLHLGFHETTFYERLSIRMTTFQTAIGLWWLQPKTANSFEAVWSTNQWLESCLRQALEKSFESMRKMLSLVGDRINR